MPSDRIVTGNALNEILHSVKNYIDSDFEEVDVENVGGSPVFASCQCENIDESVIDDIIEKHFKIGS